MPGGEEKGLGRLPSLGITSKMCANLVRDKGSFSVRGRKYIVRMNMAGCWAATWKKMK